MTRWAAGRAAGSPRAGDSPPAAAARGERGARAAQAIESAGPIACAPKEAHAMTAPVWGLELGSVRHPCTRPPRPAGAPRRAGPGDRIRVGGEPEDPGAGGVRGDGVRDEPGHALRPLGPPGTCLAAVARRDSGGEGTRGRGAANGPQAARRAAPPAPRRCAGVDEVLRAAAGTGFSSGDRAVARGRIRREGELSRLARAHKSRAPAAGTAAPVWVVREDARQNGSSPRLRGRRAFRCALCSWF